MRSALAAVILVGVLVLPGSHANADTLPLFNGDFEAGVEGWAPADGGTLTIGAAQPFNGGAAAGHVQSNAAGAVTIRSQYWRTPARPGSVYTLTLAVRIPATTISSVTARIDLVKLDGITLVSSHPATLAGPTDGYVTVTTPSVTAPPNTAWAVVVVNGAATAGGARFSIDDVVITEVVTPTPTPTPTRAPTPAPTPARVVTAVATRTAAPTASPAPVRTPPGTPTPTPAPLSPQLVNGTFDASLNGWEVVRGRSWTDAYEGPSMVLYAPSAATVWAEQTIGGIQPGMWYRASALMSTLGNVNAGWLRIAWHPSNTGDGAAITTDDSAAVEVSEEQAPTATRAIRSWTPARCRHRRTREARPCACCSARKVPSAHG